MAIGDDGNGYALTNDANHFLQFTTGKKTSVTDLGALVDDPGNKTVSIHNSCNSFGGDMIADDDGNLYLVFQQDQCFQNKYWNKSGHALRNCFRACRLSYTINGSAVDNKNQVLISSAVDNSNIYTVDIKTLAASP